MCKWGNDIIVKLQRPMGVSQRDYCGVDACIAPLVQAMNDNGMETVSSCCGHGNRPGEIILADNRSVILCTWEQSRKIDKLFPDIHGKPKKSLDTPKKDG